MADEYVTGSRTTNGNRGPRERNDTALISMGQDQHGLELDLRLHGERSGLLDDLLHCLGQPTRSHPPKRAMIPTIRITTSNQYIDYVYCRIHVPVKPSRVKKMSRSVLAVTL